MVVHVARHFSGLGVVTLALVAAACGRTQEPMPHVPPHGHGHGHAASDTRTPHGTHDDHGGHAMPHRFEDPEAWAARFDDPARDAWQKPDEVVAALALRGDESVADLGAGTGYFAMRLARAVPRGKVFAIDLEPGMVRYLGERASREHLTNVTPVTCTADDARMPEPVSVVLVVDTYHHIDDRVRYFTAVRERMVAAGRLAIVDFRIESPMGPPPPFRVGEAQVTRELEAAGFRFERSHGFLPNQYFLVFAAR